MLWEFPGEKDQYELVSRRKAESDTEWIELTHKGNKRGSVQRNSFLQALCT